MITTAKRLYPGVKVTTVVEACGSGNFMKSLYGVSDRVITSVGPNVDSLGPPRGNSGAPSPFSQSVIKDVYGKLLGGSGTVGNAAAQAEGQITDDTPAAAAQQEQGKFGGQSLADEQQPQTDQQVTAKLLGCQAKDAFFGNCSAPKGKVAVDLGVWFTTDENASGTMTIDPAGRTVSSFAPPPAYGNPAIGDIFFYASPGEKITVTANHGANSYFDGWQIHNGGRCDPPDGDALRPDRRRLTRCVRDHSRGSVRHRQVLRRRPRVLPRVPAARHVLGAPRRTAGLPRREDNALVGPGRARWRPSIRHPEAVVSPAP